MFRVVVLHDKVVGYIAAPVGYIIIAHCDIYFLFTSKFSALILLNPLSECHRVEGLNLEMLLKLPGTVWKCHLRYTCLRMPYAHQVHGDYR